MALPSLKRENSNFASLSHSELPFAHHLVINALALDHLKFMVNSLQSLDRLWSDQSLIDIAQIAHQNIVFLEWLHCPSKQLQILLHSYFLLLLVFVFDGLYAHSRQHDSFNLRNTNISKFLSERLHLFAVNIRPAVLNNLSHALEEGMPLLYSL